MAVRTVLTALSFVALAAPAMGSSVIHSAPTELGYTTHPEHAEPGKSREQVLAEMDQSKKDGTWQYHRFGAPVPVKGKAVTREEVLADLERSQKHPVGADRKLSHF